MKSLTPLHLLIAIHYHTTPGRYAADNYRHADSEAVKDYKADLVRAGLLRTSEEPSSDLVGTDGLGVYVDALCKVPLPIRKWVMP